MVTTCWGAKVAPNEDELLEVHLNSVTLTELQELSYTF